MIILPKRVFQQGEVIPVKLQYSKKDLPVQNCKLLLIGKEKAEFKIQSLSGKKGFQPILGMIFPSKHFHQETTFLNEVIENPPSGKSHDSIEIEIPLNAIPSFYGENGKVSYFIRAEYENKDGDQKVLEEQILIDAEYLIKNQKNKIKIGLGSLIMEYSSPLIINQDNSITITTNNLKMEYPIRIVLTGEESVSASGVTVNNTIKELPLGQFFSREDEINLVMKFIIPSEYQHSFKGLFSRLEYHLEIQYVHIRSHFGFKREKIQSISRIPLRVEEMKAFQ